MIRVLSLLDNVSYKKNLIGKHGLSLYIETGEHKILFDLGPDDSFAKNAKELSIDISAVDTVIISHGHYDHGGGLGMFLRLNDKAKIYIKKSAFHKYYVRIGKVIPHYIGLDQKLENNPRFVFTDDFTEIDGELTLFSGVQSKDMYSEMANGNLFSKPERRLELDKFEHEQYLVISDGSGQILVTGCSHKGIINILGQYFKEFGNDGHALTHVIGGFHLFNPSRNKAEDPAFVKKLADMLNGYDMSFYTGHCTSEKVFLDMKETMGEKLLYLSAGDNFIIQ